MSACDTIGGTMTMTGAMDSASELEQQPGDLEQSLGGTSGDPLLKRLVDLAQRGFTAEMTLYSNGQVIHGYVLAPHGDCATP
jgi:hypothetical protein